MNKKSNKTASKPWCLELEEGVLNWVGQSGLWSPRIRMHRSIALSGRKVFSSYLKLAKKEVAPFWTCNELFHIYTRYRFCFGFQGGMVWDVFSTTNSTVDNQWEMEINCRIGKAR